MKIMNKKLISLTLLCAVGFATVSAQELVVKKKDGTSVVVGDKLYFKQNGTADEWSATTDANGEYSSAFDISKIQSASVLDGLDLYLVKYQSPSYIDYYINAADSKMYVDKVKHKRRRTINGINKKR